MDAKVDVTRAPMPATTKSGRIAITQKDLDKLHALSVSLPKDLQPLPDEYGFSIKDIVGHRAHWISLFFQWYHVAQAGGVPEMQAPGFKWNQLKQYNAALRQAQSGLGWADAMALLEGEAACLLAFIQDTEESTLFGVPMVPTGARWTVGRYAKASGASHYRSAVKYIRARLRAQTG